MNTDYAGKKFVSLLLMCVDLVAVRGGGSRLVGDNANNYQYVL